MEYPALLAIIPGPVWDDNCGHPKGCYVVSFECNVAAPGNKLDMYVFPSREMPGSEVCLHYGNEESQHFSPGNAAKLAFQPQEIEPYRTAAEILAGLGYFTWHKKGRS